MMNPADWIETNFPRLKSSSYSQESPVDSDYNCIAFAAGDDQRWWWPQAPFPGGSYWPSGVAQEETLGAFVAAFETLGYAVCIGGDFEAGFEKVAIYEQRGVPTHAARQDQEGRWLSKLGQGYDIIHEHVDGVGGDDGYGNVAIFLRRPVRT